MNKKLRSEEQVLLFIILKIWTRKISDLGFMATARLLRVSQLLSTQIFNLMIRITFWLFPMTVPKKSIIWKPIRNLTFAPEKWEICLIPTHTSISESNTRITRYKSSSTAQILSPSKPVPPLSYPRVMTWTTPDIFCWLGRVGLQLRTRLRLSRWMFMIRMFI